MKSCSCSRVRHEFSSPMFDLEEVTENSGETLRIDVEQTFSPTPRIRYIGAKLAILAWVTSTTAISISSHAHPSFWLAYLTNWGWTLANAYSFLSVACAAYLAKYPPDVEAEKAGWLVSVTWGLYAIILPSQIAIALLYWVLDFDGNVSYVGVMVHGAGALIILFDGVFLSRIPLRAKQFFLYEGFALAYLLWSLIHAFSGIGNPNREGSEDDDDAIYSSIRWKNAATSAVIVSAVSILIINPILFFICRALSRSFPRRGNKKTTAGEIADDTFVY